MTIWDGGWGDQSEPEREGQHGPWEEPDDLEADDLAAWRGEEAAVHPPLGDTPGKKKPWYPGKDDALEHEGGGHGDEGEE